MQLEYFQFERQKSAEPEEEEEHDDPRFITDSSVLLPPRTSGTKRQARQPKQGRHAKKVGKYDASEPLEQLESHKQLNNEEFPEPGRFNGVANRAQNGILGQSESYKPHNQQDPYKPHNQQDPYKPHSQQDPYKPHNQRDSFNSFNQTKNPFTPLNRNDAMIPPRALAASALPEKTQNEQRQREKSIDSFPFAMLTKSQPTQPDEPVYVVNIIEQHNKQTDLDRIEEENEISQQKQQQRGKANSMWNVYL